MTPSDPSNRPSSARLPPRGTSSRRPSASSLARAEGVRLRALREEAVVRSLARQTKGRGGSVASRAAEAKSTTMPVRLLTSRSASWCSGLSGRSGSESSSRAGLRREFLSRWRKGLDQDRMRPRVRQEASYSSTLSTRVGWLSRMRYLRASRASVEASCSASPGSTGREARLGWRLRFRCSSYDGEVESCSQARARIR
jgi:hypothetical protein